MLKYITLIVGMSLMGCQYITDPNNLMHDYRQAYRRQVRYDMITRIIVYDLTQHLRNGTDAETISEAYDSIDTYVNSTYTDTAYAKKAIGIVKNVLCVSGRIVKSDKLETVLPIFNKNINEIL